MRMNKNMMLASMLMIAICLFAGRLYAAKQQTMPGEKEISVLVLHGDETEKSFSYQTDAEYLGEVLEREGLISGEMGQFGLFITTVDGETADESKQQWWCITQGGEWLNTSVDTTPIADGDQFELTLTEGY